MTAGAASFCSEHTTSPSRSIGLNSNWIGLVSHHSSTCCTQQHCRHADLSPHKTRTCLKPRRGRLGKQIHEHGLACAHSPIHVQPSWCLGPLCFSAPQKALPPAQHFASTEATILWWRSPVNATQLAAPDGSSSRALKTHGFTVNLTLCRFVSAFPICMCCLHHVTAMLLLLCVRERQLASALAS